jgi:hypothetical protein
VRGVVADCEYHGHDATVRIELGEVSPGSQGSPASCGSHGSHGSQGSVVARLAGDLVPESGTPVTMRVRGAVVVWSGPVLEDQSGDEPLGEAV